MPLSHAGLVQQFVGVAVTALEFPKIDFPAIFSPADTILSLGLHLLTEGKAGVGQLVLVEVGGLRFQPVKFLLSKVDRTGSARNKATGKRDTAVDTRGDIPIAVTNRKIAR